MNITLANIREQTTEVSQKYGWILLTANIIYGLIFVALVLTKANKASNT